MDETVKTLWERLAVHSQISQHEDLRVLADRLRCLSILNNELRRRQAVDEGSFCLLSDRIKTLYSSVVDCMDSQRGLNNYGEAILDLASSNRNEGQSWKSSLKVDEVMKKMGNSKQQTEDHGLLWPCSVVKKRTHVLPDPPERQTSPVIPVLNDKKDNVINNVDHQQKWQDSCGNFRPKSNTRQESWNTLSKRKERQFGDEGSSFQIQKRPNFIEVSKYSRLDVTANTINNPDFAETTNEDGNPGLDAFRTAREQLIVNQRKSGKSVEKDTSQISANHYGTTKRSLGTRRGPAGRFIPPVMKKQCDGEDDARGPRASKLINNRGDRDDRHGDVDERLKNIDPKMVELIENEIMDHGPPIHWDDIAGLEFAKATIQEIVVWPMLRPDIFHGLRGPPKGLLLFGPPGTGKTLIGKCIASQSHATFFSISASSLTSKWVGEGEKMVRALFAVARCHSPAVIFIDEIDSLLTQRVDGEHESSRRIKTEFLVQLDGATTKAEERFLVIGATNRPQELDEAARRRLVKRLYIPLPEGDARKQIVVNLMKEQRAVLSEENYESIVGMTDGYSGADMSNLCREAALGPIRSIAARDIRYIRPDQVRPIEFRDFQEALRHVRPSVCDKDLEIYIDWNKKFGSGASL